MRYTLGVSLAVAATLGLALTVRPARADDETEDVAIALTAPIDSVDCTAMPPTVTVAGLAIDVSNAAIDAPCATGGGGDGEGDQADGSSSGTSCDNTCGALVVGQTVEIKLWNKLDALALCAKHFGWITDKHEVTVRVDELLDRLDRGRQRNADARKSSKKR